MVTLFTFDVPGAVVPLDALYEDDAAEAKLAQLGAYELTAFLVVCDELFVAQAEVDVQFLSVMLFASSLKPCVCPTAKQLFSVMPPADVFLNPLPPVAVLYAIHLFTVHEDASKKQETVTADTFEFLDCMFSITV